MVNLHRWLKKTSPHLVIVGSLIITGLSGCRSAQFTAFEVESPTPSYPTPLVVQDAVTKTAPYTEPNAAPSAEDVTKELVLEPPHAPHWPIQEATREPALPRRCRCPRSNIQRSKLRKSLRSAC